MDDNTFWFGVIVLFTTFHTFKAYLNHKRGEKV